MEVEDPVEVMTVDGPEGMAESVDGVIGTGREEGDNVGGGDMVLVDVGRVIVVSMEGRGRIIDLSLSFSISMKSSTCTLGGRLVFGLYLKSRELVLGLEKVNLGFFAVFVSLPSAWRLFAFKMHSSSIGTKSPNNLLFFFPLG